MLVNYHHWRDLLATWWTSWKNALPALANLATVVSGFAAVLVFFVAQA
ncbi:hypothetical protein [Murinocardiopsis flavida]|nr:hypothetical protein [Murinocardiopsis flavida]